MIAHKTTPGDRAEYCGAALGMQTKNLILAGADQAERYGVLCAALQQLHSEHVHSERAIGGFAGQIINLLEQGLGLDK